MVQTFFDPKALVAGIKTQTNGPAPIVQQAASPQLTGAPSSLPDFYSADPSGMSQTLISAGMRGPQSGSPWEGVGSLAQIVGGNLLAADERKRQQDRAGVVEGQVRRLLGDDAADLYRTSDAAGRAELEKTFRASVAHRSEEARVRERTARENAGLLSATDEAGFNRAALESGNPDYAKAVVSAHAKKIAEKDASAEKVAQFATALAGGRDLQSLARSDPAAHTEIMTKARAMALGIPLESLPGKESTGAFADSWESARSPDERKVMFADALKSHHETSKTVRADAQSARRGLLALDVAEQAINSGAYTGAFADQVTLLKKIGVGLGLDLKGVSENELLNSIANELAKGARAGYPGSVSNFEMMTYLQSVVSGRNTPEGNRKILDVLRAQMNEPAQRQKDAEDWLKVRREQGKPAILAEGFDAFSAARAEKRAEAYRERLLAAREASGIGADGTPMSREEKVRRAEGGQTAPTAALSATAGMTQRAKAENGDIVDLVLEDGGWREVGRTTADGRPVPQGMTQNAAGKLKPNAQMLRDQMK